MYENTLSENSFLNHDSFTYRSFYSHSKELNSNTQIKELFTLTKPYHDCLRSNLQGIIEMQQVTVFKYRSNKLFLFTKSYHDCFISNLFPLKGIVLKMQQVTLFKYWSNQLFSLTKPYYDCFRSNLFPEQGSVFDYMIRNVFLSLHKIK